MQSGYDIHKLFQEAQNRWLKPAEVLFILQNHENQKLTEKPPQRPSSGSLFLFNRRVLRFFRRDGHVWRKKKDGRTVGEAHERLKVGNVEALNCYYAHGEQNPNFQRRSYWMLDPAHEHIVLVHYREISEGRHNSGSISNLSPGFSSTQSQSPSFYADQNLSSSSEMNEFYESYHSSVSPGSVEVSSDSVIRNNEVDHLEGIDKVVEFRSSSDPEINQALRRLEEQLSLNDEDLAEELSSYYFQNEKSKGSVILDYGKESFNEDEDVVLLHRSECSGHGQHYSGNVIKGDDSINSRLLKNAGENREHLLRPSVPEYTIETKESPSWKEVLTVIDSQEKFYTPNGNENSSPGMGEISSNLYEHQENWPSQWLDSDGCNREHRNTYNTNEEMQLSAARQFLLGSDSFVESPSSTPLLQEAENSKVSVCSSGINMYEANANYYKMWFDQGIWLGVPLGADSSLTIAQKQRFTISEISRDWGYSSETTKVIITGSFLCSPSKCAWMCMFGDIEVPVEIIQDGVLRCQAPSHVPGKVTLCITSGNREACSEIKEFEYRIKPMNCEHCNLPQAEANMSTELLLLVRFAQMLLSVTYTEKEDIIESGVNQLRTLKVDEDPWGRIIETLLLGSETPSTTMNWLLQELLKDKLQWWLLSKYQNEGDTPGCHLSKKEQGIIHVISGLGFEWALNPILNSGVSIDFRDVNGWTALHWAALYGREKMVAALLASGASAGAVTDPTSKDPTGKSPASIAAASGHKGLAGYLSEMALTSHLSSLTLEESELSRGSAAVEAEITVETISKRSLGAIDDQLSLKDSLAAVRNAAQAAARIQSAFRAHSFRKRQQKVAAADSVDEYGFAPDDIHGLSKLAFRNLHDHRLDKAALSIQKKYRGWKGRKDFLALRQKVVKIQAHVRGHQVRKKYKVLWAVGVLDKVVLRWRRRGVGLRGFRNESESIGEGEDEDILKVFRKQKVDVAIEEAVSTVLSMVESPDARQQYRRMLESYRQAKAELGAMANNIASTSQGNIDHMENDGMMSQFPFEHL